MFGGFSSLTPHQVNVPVLGHIACSSKSAIGFYLIGILLAHTSPYPLAAVHSLYLRVKFRSLTFSMRVMLDLNTSILNIIDQYGFSYSCPSTTSWTGLELCQPTIAGEMEHCLCFSMSLRYYQSIPRQELC